jgi:hypothetical protein
MLYIFWSYLNLIWRLDSSLIAIGVEPEYRSIARSLSRRGPKGEPDASTAAESEIANLVRRLKLIQRSDSSMIAIGVDAEYRSVSRSLFGWGPKGESNAPIVAGSEIMDFLRWRRSCSYSFDLLWNVRVLNWICIHARDEDVMLSRSGLSCPADWAWICSFWGGGVLLVDRSTRTGSGAGAPICPAVSALRSDRAKVRTKVECDLMKRSCILS